ncbi:MAG: DUF2147 domain-containing protein [Candidatus Cloacimonetes bacterium]|nr:DUF2147 domain-containing protein [Candidatus Cloacimonadota bacterium]
MKKLIFAIAALAMLLPLALVAEIYKIEGLWYDQDKDAKIQIYKTKSGNYDGKIVWQKVPNEDGKPKVDKKNPDKSLRSRPLMNLVIVKHLKSKGNNKYDGGTIYDPKSGNTYASKAELTGPNTMKLRGYIGVSLLGRTQTWTRATP